MICHLFKFIRNIFVFQSTFNVHAKSLLKLPVFFKAHVILYLFFFFAFQDTPLAFFLKFLSCCIEKHNYSECQSLLEQFKHSLLSKVKKKKKKAHSFHPQIFIRIHLI